MIPSRWAEEPQTPWYGNDPWQYLNERKGHKWYNRLRLSDRPLYQEMLVWSYLCVDCGKDTRIGDDYYVVHCDLWYQYGAGKRMLCLGCLESRLGRQLRKEDFKALTPDTYL